MGECGVCIETYTKRDRKKVSCPSCEYEVCAQCVQRYLLDTVNDPHCMGCKSVWGREFLDNNLQKTFINKQLKEHRENILFEREKSYFPQDQTIIAREKECIKIEKKIQEIEDNIYALRVEADRLKGEIRNVRNGVGSSSGSVKVTFVRKCPMENCKGFLGANWECQMCDSKICSKCNEKKEEGHECDPDTVATIKEIKKSCKNCPKCGTSIHKIEGCDQMWCTKCHTTFSWRSGQPVTGVVHNPHYFQYMRENGGLQRQPGDIPCGGLPTAYGLRNFDPIISEFLRIVTHVDAVEIPHYNVHNDNKKLRARFIRKQINKDEFVAKLLANERDENKSRDIRDVLEMFKTVGTDLLQTSYKELHKKKPGSELNNLQNDLITQFTQLIDYTNKQFNGITHSYKLVAPYITIERNRSYGRRNRDSFKVGISSTRREKHTKPYAGNLIVF